MILSSEVVRCEEGKNREGQDECFVSIQYIDDEIGMFMKGIWLTPDELKAYKTSKDSINTLPDKYVVAAKTQKLEAIAAEAKVMEEPIN